jgi:hypothetical protein
VADGAPSSGASFPGFVDQGWLVLGLTGLLGLQTALGLLNTALCLSLNLVLLDGVSDEQRVALSGAFATTQNSLYYLTILPFAAFLVRANKNARATSGIALEYTPASMVWWFAVPLLNLVRPYQAVRAVWEASAPSADDYLPKAGLVGVWWGFWISAGVFSRLGKLFVEGSSIEGQNVVSAISNGIAAALAGAALLMVRRLHERQLLSATALQDARS